MNVNVEAFTPKTVVCLREGYTKKQFLSDLMAGITVGIISLPLVMAFAIGAGVEPARGLFTAIIAGFLISLFGGSRVSISGPTGAFVVIIFDIVQRQGYEGLVVATLIATCILIVMGLTKCGSYIRFIPYPVTCGFTTGIAASLCFGQMKDFWGLKIPHPKAEFFERFSQFIEYAGTASFTTLLVALFTLAIIVISRRVSRKIPGAIIATIAASALVFFFDLPIDTIEKKFGPIPSSLPIPSFPKLSFESIQLLFPDGIAIALLCAVESLLCAVVADGMLGFRHKPNLELAAQGLGNLGSIIFGGIPATGAIARTTASVQLNARTPFAGMFAAGTLFVLMYFLAPYAGKIPLATLASILIFVAYNMAEIDHFKDILKGPKSDIVVLLTTFSLTLFIDLTVAVQAGVLLAAFLFLKHMSEKTTIKVYDLLRKESANESKNDILEANATKKELTIPSDVEVFEIDGPFFFGVADLLNEALRRFDVKPKVFILRMPNVPLIDGSGMQALKVFYKKCKEQHIEFLLTEVRPDVMHILQKSSVKTTLGIDRFFPTLEMALEQAKRILLHR